MNDGAFDPRSWLLRPPRPDPAADLDLAARAVLARYPPLLQLGEPQPLGNRGGFSGARLWRVTGALGPLCLRAWPPGETLEQVTFRHRLMTLASEQGLRFVPLLFGTSKGATAVAHAGRVWELTEWLPGKADYRERPTPARLEAACTALGRLHSAWERLAEAESRPCPAVRRRLERFEEWRELLRSGWNPLADLVPRDPARPLVARAWALLPRRVEQVPRLLEPWAGWRGRLQPCLCDLWHDHVLFDDDRLTGLIDYGSVKVDHVAVDLARMLGSLAEDDAASWRSGLEAYRKLRALSPEEEELARVLDRTGTVLGVATWLRWLYRERRPFDDYAAALRRMEVLVERIARWE